ncbi:MAG TPA: DUF2299 family protein [Candidatus Lokiarchaeia archaeon]|nr:DUF2299 family protein [Candidatus Lokiarchaeia archaeon]
MAKKESPDIVSTLKDWSIEEGVMSIKLPDDPNLAYGFELKFPPNAPAQKKLQLLGPVGKDFLILQLGTQMAPEHVEIFQNSPVEKQVKFFSKMKKFFYAQNLLFNVDAQNFRWAIIDQIYYGSLTKNLFFRTLRRVFYGSLYVDDILGEIILGGAGFGGSGGPAGPGSSLYL